ncbi:hypothetical protein BH10PSE2_BH10PSE2_08180 [soil metagenome]
MQNTTVRALQILLTLFGALALLSLGAVSAIASPMVPAPCHAMADMADHSGSKGQPAPKAAMAMGCCVACVAPPAVLPTPAAAPDALHSVVTIGFPALPLGRRPSPEPGPPKT